MITDREIIKIANEVYGEFLTNFLIDCNIESVSMNKYIGIAEKNRDIQILMDANIIKNIKDIFVPVIVNPGEKIRMIFCGAIVSKILKGFSKEKQKNFVKALTLHELYHIVNNVEKRELNQYNFIRSDKRAYQEFKDDYPDFAKLLEEAKKRFKIK